MDELQSMSLELAFAAGGQLVSTAMDRSDSAKSAKLLLSRTIASMTYDLGEPFSRARVPAISLLLLAISALETDWVPVPQIDLDKVRKLLKDGEINAADSAADSLLEMVRMMELSAAEYEDSFHAAHIMKGLVHFAKGDTNDAISELLLAGATEGSPVLNSFGPDLSLAWKLLAVDGEAVLTYLRAVSRFWSPE